MLGEFQPSELSNPLSFRVETSHMIIPHLSLPEYALEKYYRCLLRQGFNILLILMFVFCFFYIIINVTKDSLQYFYMCYVYSVFSQCDYQICSKGKQSTWINSHISENRYIIWMICITTEWKMKGGSPLGRSTFSV